MGTRSLLGMDKTTGCVWHQWGWGGTSGVHTKVVAKAVLLWAPCLAPQVCLVLVLSSLEWCHETLVLSFDYQWGCDHACIVACYQSLATIHLCVHVYMWIYSAAGPVIHICFHTKGQSKFSPLPVCTYFILHPHDTVLEHIIFEQPFCLQAQSIKGIIHRMRKLLLQACKSTCETVHDNCQAKYIWVVLLHQNGFKLWKSNCTKTSSNSC